MNRPLTFAFFALVASFLIGCDKQGIHPYGEKTDVIISCGPPASVHVRSSSTGTDILIVGNLDPSTMVGAGFRRCMMTATVARDSSTTLLYGSYELDAAGKGKFFATSSYEFVFEPNIGVSGRQGSQRSDFGDPWENPFTIAVAGDKTTLTYTIDDPMTPDVDDPSTHTYTAFPSVVANIDLAGPTGWSDLYNAYNLALFLSQVRIPAFGGLGMTRYINNTTHFQGLVAGEYSVGVESILNPKVTMSYTALEDFPGVLVNGDQITNVNISGNGPMSGALDFEIRDPVNPANVLYAGSVDYGTIQISDGLPVSGNYIVTTTIPTAAGPGLVPYTNASNVDLTNLLPVTP